MAHGYGTSEFGGNINGAQQTLWHRLITAPDVLRQRVALALSEFFVVSISGVTQIQFRQFVMAAWWDVLCEKAFGNYRDLLEAVTLSNAMGRYLNMAGNKKEDAKTGRQPDENYAREVMQLFSIGLYQLNLDGTPITDSQGRALESYTPNDVSQLARVFTGWDIAVPSRTRTTPDFALQPMALTASNHSTLEARFLNTTVPAGTDGISALRIALDT